MRIAVRTTPLPVEEALEFVSSKDAQVRGHGPDGTGVRSTPVEESAEHRLPPPPKGFAFPDVESPGNEPGHPLIALRCRPLPPTPRLPTQCYEVFAMESTKNWVRIPLGIGEVPPEVVRRARFSISVLDPTIKPR